MEIPAWNCGLLAALRELMLPFPNLIRKARSTVGIVRTIENWWVALLDHAGLSSGHYTCKLKNGLDFQVRAGTDDSRVLFEIYVQKCYGAAVVKPGATVVDIGANIGCFSILAAQKASRVIACEPHPDNLEILRKNVAIDRTANVEIIPCAISSVSGKSALFLPDDDTFVGRYSLQNERGTRSIEVTCLTLEDLFRQAHLTLIDLIKIDCEGSEYEILYGITGRTLSQIQQIIMECHVIPDHPRWSQSELGKFLQGEGFEVVNNANLLYARRAESREGPADRA
jgi:FkbM family methyltransferase